MILIDYLLFSLGFLLIHTFAYIFAGAIALKISGGLYREEQRLIDFHRDMSDEKESSHVEKYFIPAQLIRGFLMSIVLYPILGLLGNISFPLRFAFLTGLMIIFADFACANPFSHNIEGFVYMKERYLNKKYLPKLYFETITHGVIFGALAGWFLF